jgi:hypothetical protein
MHVWARKDANLMEPPMREILFLGPFCASVLFHHLAYLYLAEPIWW